MLDGITSKTDVEINIGSVRGTGPEDFLAKPNVEILVGVLDPDWRGGGSVRGVAGDK